MNTRKLLLITALRRFVAQRPGLEFANYGDVSAYRSELRGITKDRHQAEQMLDAIAWRDSIDADAIIAASKHAFSGRLTINEAEPGVFSLDYCTGQYWPTEYRRAVCSVISGALWDYWRNNGAATGDDIRRIARNELSRGIASRWFN